MLDIRLRRKIDRWIAQTHRWLGIGVCVLFVVWFASGLIMLYVNSPQLTQSEELRSLEAIDWGQLKIGPAEAIASAGYSAFPKLVRLEMLAGAPYYRLSGWNGETMSISAVDGTPLNGVAAPAAVSIAQHYASAASTPSWNTEIDSDQWTFESKFDAARPFHLVSLNDSQGTELYVSSRSGQVVLDTTRAERFWNWPGEVAHLAEFADFRQRELLWRQFMLWSTVLSTIVATLGIWLGIKRLRLIRRYPRGNSMTPYRGMMKWHHVVGLLGGLFLWVWIIGGLVYLRPMGFLERQTTSPASLHRYAGQTAPDFPVDLTSLGSAAPDDIRQADFKWLGGKPLVVLRNGTAESTVFDTAEGRIRPLRTEELLSAAGHLLETGAIERSAILSRPDEHWHTFRLTYRQLPILRVEFGDPARHWFHIDPWSGDILNMTTSGDRAFRWLFNGLHKLDFLVLLEHKWLRDFVVLPLMVSGLIISVTGVIVGFRYVKRKRR